MAKPINDEIQTNIKELITRITHYETDTSEFNKIEKCILSTLKKSDTMYFLNTKDIKTAISSMAEKFMFHGFFKHAQHLQKAHDKYIDKNLSESDLTPRLNIVKFLLCMSNSPTNNFWQSPEQFDEIIQEEIKEEEIDWGAYLTEGIEKWSPIKGDSLDLSDSGDELTHDQELSKIDGASSHHTRTVIKEVVKEEKYDFRAVRNELFDSIQHSWYGGSVVCMNPESQWFDANVGILWEQHLQEQTQGLIEIDPLTVISEYKVMREVMWQLWGPHNSTVFELLEGRLCPRPNVTISSVCSMTFENFMKTFITYCEILDEFRQFHRDLDKETVSETYRSYGNALKKITKPFFDQLIEIESEIRDQDKTMTLLVLGAKLESIFEPIRVLKIIHDEVIGDFEDSPPLECALTLLTRLRTSLQFSINKLEQDIRLTLYLESLYYYFTLIDAWLVKNDLSDYTSEFVILNKNNSKSAKNSENPEMNFFLVDNIQNFCENDGMIKLISDQVLQIGRNIHLLRLLGKWDVFVKGSESIHQEFVRRILEELSTYYGCENHENKDNEIDQTQRDQNQVGDWSDFVDLSDGLLVKAFEGFYSEKEENKVEEKSLFEKISEITSNLFPLQNLPENVFSQILRDRFTISGLLVKNLLIENYQLDKQFEFLNHIFLFESDLIFPFYRRLFEKMNIEHSNWGNSVWLTSHLQDVIMDLYPNFYEHCTAQVEDHWKQCQDSLEACTLLSIQYEIKWPLSIIITKEHLNMYRGLFEFILKLRWALYTINHLSFSDVESRKASKYRIQISKKLKHLRFNLINVLNTIQHYFFGFIFTKHKIQFELDFEKANDLKSLIAAHDNFITNIHRSMMEIRDKKSQGYGFDTLLRSVKMLKVMWNRQEYATHDHLESCYKTYKSSFEVINPVINPIYVYDS